MCDKKIKRKSSLRQNLPSFRGIAISCFSKLFFGYIPCFHLIFLPHEIWRYSFFVAHLEMAVMESNVADTVLMLDSR